MVLWWVSERVDICSGIFSQPHSKEPADVLRFSAEDAFENKYFYPAPSAVLPPSRHSGTHGLGRCLSPFVTADY